MIIFFFVIKVYASKVVKPHLLTNPGCYTQIDHFTVDACAMILVINFPFALHYCDQGTGIGLLGVKIVLLRNPYC